jgi:hypothetical protein
VLLDDAGGEEVAGGRPGIRVCPQHHAHQLLEGSGEAGGERGVAIAQDFESQLWVPRGEGVRERRHGGRRRQQQQQEEEVRRLAAALDSTRTASLLEASSTAAVSVLLLLLLPFFLPPPPRLGP